MKKAMALIASLALLTALAGCAQGGQSEQRASEETSATQEQPSEQSAPALEDSLRGLSYAVPAGWTSRSSGETGKSYTNGRAIMQITASDAPTPLSGESDAAVQVALMSFLSTWDDVALNGLDVDAELSKVNGLRMLGAALELDQNGTVLDMHLKTFEKGGVAFIAGVSAPATMNTEDAETFASLIASCN